MVLSWVRNINRMSLWERYFLAWVKVAEPDSKHKEKKKYTWCTFNCPVHLLQSWMSLIYSPTPTHQASRNGRVANCTWKIAIAVKEEMKRTLLLCAREALTANLPSQHFKKLVKIKRNMSTSACISVRTGTEPQRLWRSVLQQLFQPGSPLSALSLSRERQKIEKTCHQHMQWAVWELSSSRRPSLLVLLNPATEPITRSLGGKGELLWGDASPWGKTLPPSLQPPCPATSDSAGRPPQPLKHMGEWSSCPGLGKWHLCHCNGLGAGLSPAGVAPQWDLLWR